MATIRLGSVPHDRLDSLPTDESNVSQKELAIVNSLFKEQYSTMQKIVHELKDIILLGVLFVIFSLKYLDDLITGYVPVTKTSDLILIIMKAVAFMVCFFLIKNLYLVRKK